MELEHSFSIPVPVEQAWPILLDIRQIAPCMPGAAVDSVDGDDFTGSVKVKLGPINLTYKGQAKFVEKDEANHKAVIDARGRDSRGNGTASAKITATLTGSGDTTECKVITDLNITGKPAQFGRGVMVDVGNKLIGQFADCLAGKLGADDGPTAGTQTGSAGKSADAQAAPQTAAASADKGSAASADTSAKSGSDSAVLPAASANTAAVKDARPGTQPQDKARDAADQQAAASASPSTTPSGTDKKPSPAQSPVGEPEPIDLIELAGGTVAKKVAPAALGALLLALIVSLIVRKKNS
ncbi:SRPBCC family protein [Blastococcus sp. Marseille-P5729]|uniref:SRPBCC family protein n=1 Tax=Blastococcus sp. Marseille-P5729 TaxID=2086582 RepID=UPI000D0FB159|nr:SRPBCC family protein [Blastococcus sp. Marseille-P5729]